MAAGQQSDGNMRGIKFSKKENKLFSEIVRVCGEESVSRDETDRAFFSSDLYQAGALPDIVVTPTSSQDLAKVIKLARGAKRPVYVRGGGMSYSNACLLYTSPSPRDATLSRMPSSA